MNRESLLTVRQILQANVIAARTALKEFEEKNKEGLKGKPGRKPRIESVESMTEVVSRRPRKAAAGRKRGRKKAAAMSTTSVKRRKTRQSSTAAKSSTARKSARGSTPSLAISIPRVIGVDGKMRVAEIQAALERKGLMPESKNPTGYIHQVLSSKKELFKKVERGVYALSAKGRKVIGEAVSVTSRRSSAQTLRKPSSNSLVTMDELEPNSSNEVDPNPFSDGSRTQVHEEEE